MIGSHYSVNGLCALSDEFLSAACVYIIYKCVMSARAKKALEIFFDLGEPSKKKKLPNFGHLNPASLLYKKCCK